jgi:AcrR family transcriptional regulator
MLAGLQGLHYAHPEVMDEAIAGLRERKRARTRRAIADAALELFARQGFHATTIPQIAEAADVSPRTVSGYFPAKEDLAFPDADERITALERRLRARATGETAADALRAWLPEIVGVDAETVAEQRCRRAVIDADEDLCAYERRYFVRAQTALTEAFAADLGVAPDALEPRMAAAATVTVFELLGRDVDVGEPHAALAALDRALVFIGGGIGALQH